MTLYQFQRSFYHLKIKDSSYLDYIQTDAIFTYIYILTYKYMFSLQKGKEIAIIRGGCHDGKMIYLADQNKKCCIDCTGPKCGCCDKCGKLKGAGCFACKKKKLDFKDEDVKLFPFLKKINDSVNGMMEKVKIDDGIIVPIPGQERECLYIAGPSGSGKSTYAARYIKLYKKLFPKNKLYVFSNVKEDEALDKLIDGKTGYRIELNHELVDDPYDAKEFKNSIVLFDDIDYITDEDIRKVIKHLRDTLLEVGRHYNTYVITTAHNLTAGKDSRLALLESTSITFFPKGGDTMHIKRMLKEYVGLSQKQMNYVLNSGETWVTIYKRFPIFVLTSNNAFFPKNIL